jgi:hypothetical protein
VELGALAAHLGGALLQAPPAQLHLLGRLALAPLQLQPAGVQRGQLRVDEARQGEDGGQRGLARLRGLLLALRVGGPQLLEGLDVALHPLQLGGEPGERLLGLLEGALGGGELQLGRQPHLEGGAHVPHHQAGGALADGGPQRAGAQGQGQPVDAHLRGQPALLG